MKFWLGVITAALSLGASEVPYTVLTETYVEQVRVEVQPEPWRFEPLTSDLEEHAQCLIDLIASLDLELTVDNLFIVADFADLQGGPCGMLP